MPKLILVRHGQASFGSSDYDVLSERGHVQAEHVAAELGRRDVEPAVAVSGALKRQRDTAAATGLAVETDARWNEYEADAVLARHSDSTDRLETEGLDSRSFQVVLDGALTAWAADAEGTYGAFSRGITAAMGELWERLGGGATGVVFTSGGTIAAACSAVLGAPELFVPLNRVTVNGAFTIFTHGRSGTSLLTFNDHAHLSGDLITFR